MSNIARFVKLGGRVSKQLSTFAACGFRGQNTGMTVTTPRFYPGETTKLGKSVNPFLACESRRMYNRKKTQYKAPTKPFAFHYIPDHQVPLEPLDPSIRRPGYEDIPELDSADERLQRIYSLEYGDGRDIKAIRMKDILEKTQQHPTDVRSLEVRVAASTIHIRNQMKHCDSYRKDKKSKSLLWRRIRARQKRLVELRQLDYERFLWLCEELSIKYIPEPEYNTKLGKRAQAKKDAREQMIAVKRQKLQQYKEQLQKEKEMFLKQKEIELSGMEKDLNKYGVTDTSSVESILKQLNLGPPYEIQKEKATSRRKMVLEKKFALYAHRRAQTPT